MKYDFDSDAELVAVKRIGRFKPGQVINIKMSKSDRVALVASGVAQPKFNDRAMRSDDDKFHRPVYESQRAPVYTPKKKARKKKVASHPADQE